MQTHLLVAHPDHPPASVSRVEARIIGFDAHWLRVRWRIEGSGGAAKLLGMNPSTLRSRMAKLGIERPR